MAANFSLNRLYEIFCLTCTAVVIPDFHAFTRVCSKDEGYKFKLVRGACKILEVRHGPVLD